MTVFVVPGSGKGDPENLSRFLDYLHGLELTEEEMAARQRRAMLDELADQLEWPCMAVFRGSKPTYSREAIAAGRAWCEGQHASV